MPWKKFTQLIPFIARLVRFATEACGLRPTPHGCTILRSRGWTRNESHPLHVTNQSTMGSRKDFSLENLSDTPKQNPRQGLPGTKSAADSSYLDEVAGFAD